MPRLQIAYNPLARRAWLPFSGAWASVLLILLLSGCEPEADPKADIGEVRVYFWSVGEQSNKFVQMAKEDSEKQSGQKIRFIHVSLSIDNEYHSYYWAPNLESQEYMNLRLSAQQDLELLSQKPISVVVRNMNRSKMRDFKPGFQDSCVAATKKMLELGGIRWKFDREIYDLRGVDQLYAALMTSQ